MLVYLCQIEQEYREVLQKSEGDSSRQIQAKQRYQENLGQQFEKKHFAKLESIKSEKELSNLAPAFQNGEQPVQAQTIIDRMVLFHRKIRQGHTLRVRHYANHDTEQEKVLSTDFIEHAVLDLFLCAKHQDGT